MAWCHQATSHYLGQCWPRSMSPYGINGTVIENMVKVSVSSSCCDGTVTWKPDSWKTDSYILYSQYHCYWCPGSLHCQGISSLGIILVSAPDYSSWTWTVLAKTGPFCGTPLLFFIRSSYGSVHRCEINWLTHQPWKNWKNLQIILSK